MLDETGGRVLIEYSIGLFGEDMINAERARKSGGAVPCVRNLERNMEKRAKVRLGRGENIGELAENVSLGLQ